MTDLQKTKELFKSFGVNSEETKQGDYIILSSENMTSENHEHNFELGYSGFTADIYFNTDGSFKGMGGFE